MPRQFSTPFSTYITSRENSQIARLYWVQTISGTSFKLTDWIFPVTASVPNPRTNTLETTTFTPHQGFDPTAFVDESRLAVTNAEFSSYFKLDGISADEIYAGLFSGAIISVFLYLPDTPTPVAELIYQGEVGEVNESGIDEFKMEFRGTAQALQQKIGQTVSESCPRSFADKIGCRATPFTGSGTITQIDSLRQVHVNFSADTADNFWQSGVAIYQGSQAKFINYRIEIASSVRVSATTSRLTFFYPFPFQVLVGDNVSALSGCRKTIEDCQGRYNNIADFGGFPHLPGRDKLLVGRG